MKYTDKGIVEFGYILTDNHFDENKIYKIVHSSSTYLELFVKDTGIGISEKQQQIIFEAFQKVEEDRSKFHRGIGLGLTLVKSLVINMNGLIYIDSEINKGTKISIKFPVSEI
ncbi:MAG: ATP-binding protein [Bacteroidales bacterium]|nr:ATP-binding protein [Bacteroidales bacterium]